MNLENLGLAELNAQEVQEVEGGFWNYVLMAAGWYLYETFDNVSASKKAFQSGWDAAS